VVHINRHHDASFYQPLPPKSEAITNIQVSSNSQPINTMGSGSKSKSSKSSKSASQCSSKFKSSKEEKSQFTDGNTADNKRLSTDNDELPGNKGKRRRSSTETPQPSRRRKVVNEHRGKAFEVSYTPAFDGRELIRRLLAHTWAKIS
jgi:hypothetical protein